MIENIILEKYNEIFDEKGRVKLCGREKCIEFIELLSSNYPGINFGNKETGMMNVSNINEFMLSII
jgi:hypothetical protein